MHEWTDTYHAACTGHAQIQTRQGPSAEIGKWAQAPGPNTKTVSSYQLLTNKILVVPRESSWVYKPHLRMGPMSTHRWPTQSKPKGVCGVFCLILIYLSVLCVRVFCVCNCAHTHTPAYVSMHFLCFLFCCCFLVCSFCFILIICLFFICLFDFLREREKRHGVVQRWKGSGRRRRGNHDQKILYKNNFIFN